MFGVFCCKYEAIMLVQPYSCKSCSNLITEFKKRLAVKIISINNFNSIAISKYIILH